MAFFQVVWAYLFPWPLLIIGKLVLIGYIAQRYGVGMPPRDPYEISNSSLRINNSKYGGPVPLSSLKLEDARVVDISKEKDFQPHLRTMGIATKGYQSGWFKLRNLKSALVHITEPSKVVFIPTSADYVLLLSADNPDTFIAELRERNAAKLASGPA